MKNQEKASISIMKIMCISLILILLSGIGVMAVNTNLKDIKIILKNGYELTTLTSKSTVQDILKENNIILEENEKTLPDLEETVEEGTIIKIVETTLEQLMNNYAPITEKIVVEQVAIPFETITKNTAGTSTNTTNKVIKQGKDGLKEITYKVKYQNDVEIEKVQLSEKIIKEPVNKIVQVNKKVVTSRSGINERTANVPSGSGTEIYKITAYCPCTKCCGKTNGITASGARATAGVTVAASSKFAFGTKLNINGHIYTVQDRGGAIKGNKIDIFVNSHAEALAWGVRYLPVSVAK